MFERHASTSDHGRGETDRIHGYNHLLLSWTTWGFVWPDPLPYQSDLELDSVSVWIDASASLESNRPETVQLDPSQQQTVSREIKNFILLHRWKLHAICVQSNLVRMAITANESADRIRDRIKANATRTLRQRSNPIIRKRIWNKGGTTKTIMSPPVLEELIRQLSGQANGPSPTHVQG